MHRMLLKCFETGILLKLKKRKQETNLDWSKERKGMDGGMMKCCQMAPFSIKFSKLLHLDPSRKAVIFSVELICLILIPNSYDFWQDYFNLIKSE